jgi:hypothetical protein
MEWYPSMTTFQVEASKVFYCDSLEEWEITIDDLRQYMIDNNIPLDAVIRYAGCGSHVIEFAWEAREGKERDSILAIREEARRHDEALRADKLARGLL